MRIRATAAAAAATVTVCAPGAVAPAPSAGESSRPAPTVEQLIVKPSGAVRQRRVRARATRTRVARKRCAVAQATPMAALLRSKPGRIGLRDYGSCSGRLTRASGQLFVRSLLGVANRGADGWVYKVGDRLATAGAADPSGPFGRRRLRSKARVTWFYCRMTRAGRCQRTLALDVLSRAADGATTVAVRGYDDDGRSVAVAGAEVSGGTGRAITDAAGRASLRVGARRALRARKSGMVTSFAEVVGRPG